MDIVVKDFQEKTKTFSMQDLYNIYKQCNYKSIEKKLDYVEKFILKINNYPQASSDLKHKLSHFKSQFKLRWIAASRKEVDFIKKNSNWLETVVHIPIYVAQRTGRPKKSFVASSEKSKRRKTQELRESITTEELTFAAQMSLRASGQTDTSKVLKDMTTTSPKRATRYRRAFEQPMKVVQLIPSEALSIFLEAELSRRQYEIIRNVDPLKFPCYTYIQRAKQDCYPKREAYTVTATRAELNLQYLMDHTSQRLAEYLKNVLKTLTPKELVNLELISKWGCDGSHQAQYKQKFTYHTESDENIFQSSFVPIRLVCKSQKDSKIIWQNPIPSSPRYCRPIRIRFVKESNDITNEEVAYIENQIKKLEKSVFNVDDTALNISHNLLFTMVDGKICNALTNTSATQKCYVCGATAKEFNNLELLKTKSVDTHTFRFGLSILHARIRFLENILHLSYRIPLKTWQARGQDKQNVVKAQKKKIQQQFKNETGLLIDYPRQGFGNSNEGNTSRRFFSEPELAARITGVDCELINRYKIILETISSGHLINTEKFSTYCMDTAKLYIKLYSWYPMPPTIHKILIHGSAIISSALLPIGQLSEEAAEARNKYFKNYRLNFARKFSREACNMDILNRLLLKSDPVMTGLRKNIPRKKSSPFLKETIEMLMSPHISSTDLRLETEIDDFTDSGDE